jgi:signal transduction histidine kinase
MNLYTAVDEILGLAQQIQGFVQSLLQADDFTDEQWDYLQPFEQAVNPLVEILTELQADAQILPADDVVAVLAMDCRTPLNVLLGYSQLFLMGENGSISAYHHSIFQHILELANTMEGMIDAILDESRSG